jgi:uncharacterized membrane protein YcaP (DUF421 family)
MTHLLQVDWDSVFRPSLSLLEIALRGSIVYLTLFVLFRVIAKRQVGSLGVPDVLLIVLVADASQNALGKDYQSITEGLVLVLTLLGWNYALDWLEANVPVLRRVLQSPPLVIVEDGRLNRRNMRKELLTEDELMAEIRRNGLERLDQVRRAVLESDGKISVVPRPGSRSIPRERRDVTGPG